MSPDVSRYVPAALKGVALAVLLLLGRKAFVEIDLHN